MKTILNYRMLLLIILVIFTLWGFKSIKKTKEAELIVGTWTIEDELNNKWEFSTDNTCKWIIDNEIIFTFSYSIETTSPQCDVEVDEGALYSYLKLINKSNPDDKYCYEILSLDEKILQLRYLQKGGSISLKKEISK